MPLTSIQLRLLATALYQYFHKMDDPPADAISVPLEKINKDNQVDNIYYATIRFEVDYCGKKTNSVRIKFKVSEKGQFIPATYHYV